MTDPTRQDLSIGQRIARYRRNAGLTQDGLALRLFRSKSWVTKVERGERLTRDDALALFRSPDLLTLGRLADLANRRRNGDRVFFAANQHLNPTNVCVLRNTCVFCSFARLPHEDGAYTRTLDEV